ncbi:hypothetical protein ACFWIP_32695, partial [Streptomyces anulatus]
PTPAYPPAPRPPPPPPGPGRGGGPSTAVRIGYTARILTVAVLDEGPCAPGSSITPGTGLTGMRERVAALGGTLVAAPRPDGGFAVHAELPLALPLPGAASAR